MITVPSPWSVRLPDWTTPRAAPARSRSTGPAARPAARGFRALVEQVAVPVKPAPNPQPAIARTRVAFTPPGAEVRLIRTSQPMPEHTRSAAAVHEQVHSLEPGHSAPPAVTATPSPVVGGTDPGWYTPIAAPQPLEPLFAALRKEGINPGQLHFEQLEAAQTFPGRPDFNYTSRQILVRGAHASALFDLGLALRTPWVTAVEMRAYGIV